MSKKKEESPRNQVRDYAVYNEQIRKEMRHHRLTTEFAFNPFRKIHRITGKIGSRHDATEGEPDVQFRHVIERACLEPVKKYAFPVTESQEIGWISQPLIKVDQSDFRLHHARMSCPITKLKEDELRRVGHQPLYH